MAARIYQPARTATQSGHAKTKEWVLEYEPEERREIEPLMGWTSSGDMNAQVRLEFPALQDAITYAQRNNIPYRVMEPHKRKVTKKAYADNFRYGRLISWTH